MRKEVFELRVNSGVNAHRFHCLHAQETSGLFLRGYSPNGGRVALLSDACVESQRVIRELP